MVCITVGWRQCLFFWVKNRQIFPKKMSWPLVSLDFKGEIWHFFSQEHHDTLQGHLKIYSFEKLFMGLTMEQCQKFVKLPPNKTLSCLTSYVNYWIFAIFSLCILAVHQTLPLQHKTLCHSSLFICIANGHCMDSRMMSLEFGHQNLETWSWKLERP